MGLYRFWEKLNPLQKFVSGSVAAAVIAVPVTSAMGWLGAHVPLLSFMSVIASYLIGVASDRLVIGLFVGAIVFGLGPLLWNFLKSIAPANWARVAGALFPFIGMGLVGYTLLGDVYRGRVNAPATFTPPAVALHDEHGKARQFSKWTLGELEAPFKDHTDVLGEREISSQVAKWIAVTGPLENVVIAADGNAHVVLSGPGTPRSAQLWFEGKWIPRLASMDKGNKVYAICLIADADQYMVSLDACELIQQP